MTLNFRLSLRATDQSWTALVKKDYTQTCANAACTSSNFYWDDGTPFNNVGLFTMDGSSTASTDLNGRMQQKLLTSQSAQVCHSVNVVCCLVVALIDNGEQ